jgi:Flp pilus assembly protein TadG
MNRNRKGVSVIEMVVGLLVVIPVVLLLVDVLLITLGVQVNDHDAREAVRLAASGDPSQAQFRAQAVIDRLNKSSSGYVSNVTLKSLTFSPTNLLATEASLIPYGGVIQGSVTVITQVTITPVAISYVYSGPFNFQSSQTCPITYDVPNTAGGQPVPP